LSIEKTTNMKSWNTTITIPLTKLLPPQLTDGTLDRARLVHDIHQSAMTKRLILIAAPAGAEEQNIVNAFLELPAKLEM
jgi:ATP/maltotriose-dependent transcriptional regulator MalT